VGGLAGALITANMDRSPNKGRIMFFGAIGTGVFLVLFSFSGFFVALLMTALVGMMSMIFVTVNNTVITSTIPDNVRGRVSSVMMMTFGLMPLGAVPASIAAESIGVRGVTAIGAVLLVLSVALTYAVFPQFRRLETPARQQPPWMNDGPDADTGPGPKPAETQGGVRPFSAASGPRLSSSSPSSSSSSSSSSE
jgi:MFS family permease